jgi:hypothetical protein
VGEFRLPAGICSAEDEGEDVGSCSDDSLPGLSNGIVMRTSSKRAPTVLPVQPLRNSSPTSGGEVPPDKSSRWHFEQASA